MTWEIVLHKAVDEWFLDLCETDPDTAELIEEAIDQLATEGPALGRPLVDHIKNSRYHRMKELRVPSAGRSEARLKAYERGHKLAEMRKAAQMTQREVAERLGVSQSRISQIESGEVSGIDIFRDYAAAIGGEAEFTLKFGTRSWAVA